MYPCVIPNKRQGARPACIVPIHRASRLARASSVCEGCSHSGRRRATAGATPAAARARSTVRPPPLCPSRPRLVAPAAAGARRRLPPLQPTGRGSAGHAGPFPATLAAYAYRRASRPAAIRRPSLVVQRAARAAIRRCCRLCRLPLLSTTRGRPVSTHATECGTRETRARWALQVVRGSWMRLMLQCAAMA